VVPKFVACPAQSVSAHGGGNFGAGFWQRSSLCSVVTNNRAREHGKEDGVVDIDRPPRDLPLWQASLGFREQKKQGPAG
jgi:hypothetical protein